MNSLSFSSLRPRIVLIRRERLIHAEGLRPNPRRNEVDPDALRWTPSTAIHGVLSEEEEEEEREAEMDVSFLVQSRGTSELFTLACNAVIGCLFD